MTISAELGEQIQQFITRPAVEGLDYEDWNEIHADMRSATLAYLLGSLEALIEPGAPALTKKRLAKVVSTAIAYGVTTEQNQLARIAKRHTDAIAMV
jgi:hypothetical protein